MAWYLNKALTNFREEVNRRWPNRDKRSDGTIGDAAHQATSSDHNPDPDGSVDAWDMDVDGVDVWECINAAIQHESIQYIIYNGRITSRSWGLGNWRTYTGSNRHDKHVHFNTRESHENSDKPWFKEEDMPLVDSDKPIISNAVHNTYIGKSGLTFGQVLDVLRVNVPEIEKKVDALAAKVAELQPTATGDVTVTVSDEQLERVLRKIIGAVDNI